jgi:hypothetical protein
MTMAAYYGFVASKNVMDRVVRALTATQFSKRDFKFHYLTRDVETARVVAGTCLKFYDSVTIEGLTTKFDGVEMVESLHGLEEYVSMGEVIKYTTTRDKHDEFDDYLKKLKAYNMRQVMMMLARGPKILIVPMFLLRFDLDKCSGYTPRYYAHPRVHASLATVVWVREDIALRANPIDFVAHSRAVIVSNVMRNTYFLHRRPINEYLRESGYPVVDLVPINVLSPKTVAVYDLAVTTSSMSVPADVEYVSSDVVSPSVRPPVQPRELKEVNVDNRRPQSQGGAYREQRPIGPVSHSASGHRDERDAPPVMGSLITFPATGHVTTSPSYHEGDGGVVVPEWMRAGAESEAVYKSIQETLANERRQQAIAASQEKVVIDSEFDISFANLDG